MGYGDHWQKAKDAAHQAVRSLGTNDKATLQTKTLGPPGLTGVTAKPGNGRIEIGFAALGEGGVEDVIGVTAYCDRAPVAAEHQE